jgi:hypothetical protein
MKSSNLRICGVLFMTAATCVMKAEAAEKIESSPIESTITLDGNPSDWEGTPLTYLEESLHVMAIAHDDDHLYLMYRFADERLARQILMRGVTLWINGNGKTSKKKEAFAVRYPGSEQIAEQFEDERKDSRPGRSQAAGSGSSSRGGPPPSLAGMRQMPGQLTVIRMGLKDSGDEGGPEGPIAASAFAEGVFCYELRIPFADIGGKIAASDHSKKRNVAVGIQIGGMTNAETEAMQAAMDERIGGTAGMGRMGGRGGGGMGGMGGHPGGRMGSPSGERRGQMDPDIEWLSVTLPSLG